MEKRQKQYDEDGCVIRINKEEEKRKREVIKTFVRDELLSLSNDKYAKLPIDDRLKAALVEAKRLSGNAYQRHLSFVVRLVCEQDVDKIQKAFERVHHPHRNDAGKMSSVENYRNRLIEGDKSVIDELLEKFCDIDIQYLRQLARNAAKEQRLALKKQQQDDASSVKSPAVHTVSKSAKLLYQYLFKLELRGDD